MFDLTGKIALVTGASGGIGGAIAKGLHTQGATVVLSGTRAEALEKLASELGGRTAVMACNLADQGQASGLVGRVEAELGQLDILVNNAGLTRDGLAVRMKNEDWQEVIDINLTAAFRLAKASLKGMMKRRWGRIVSISSIVGHTGNPGQANYVTSKAGLTGLTKALAQEVATRGITVNCVAPGMIETPMTDALNEQQRARLLVAIPMQRLGKVDEIASAVSYLASDEAGYVTGQTLHVNGGMAMI
jgi:3-oxoacyl-[acyl-carrier protein] reductase